MTKKTTRKATAKPDQRAGQAADESVDQSGETPEESVVVDEAVNDGGTAEEPTADADTDVDAEVEVEGEGDSEAADAGEAGEVGGGEVEVETTYSVTPGGQRVTRRTVRRVSSTVRTEEDVDEVVTEDLPPFAGYVPASGAHPAPVG